MLPILLLPALSPGTTAPTTPSELSLRKQAVDIHLPQPAPGRSTGVWIWFFGSPPCPCRAAGGEAVLHGEERELCSHPEISCSVIVRRAATKVYPEYFLTQITAPTLLLFPSLMCYGAFIRALPYPRSTKVSSGSIYTNTSRTGEDCGLLSCRELFLLQPNLDNCWLVHTHCESTQKRFLIERSTFSSKTFWWRASLRLTLGWGQ